MSVPVKPPFKRIEIHIEWEDGFGQKKKTFTDVQQFADFLKENPVVARAVGYVPKKR